MADKSTKKADQAEEKAEPNLMEKMLAKMPYTKAPDPCPDCPNGVGFGEREPNES